MRLNLREAWFISISSQILWRSWTLPRAHRTFSCRCFSLASTPTPCNPSLFLGQPPPQGHRLLVMATTAIPYLLEDLMLVQAFMVSLHVPQLQGGDSVKTVLRELVPMSQVRRGWNDECTYIHATTYIHKIRTCVVREN